MVLDSEHPLRHVLYEQQKNIVLKKMKLIFIGSGSAFTVGADNYQSNRILEDDSSKKLLVDCGSDARFALHELGLSYKDIEAVYISHLHSLKIDFKYRAREFHDNKFSICHRK